jgi:hypothetical protein
MNSVMHEMNGLRRAAMTPNRWAGGRMLQTAHRLNERCFSLLAETVRIGGARVELRMMYDLRELWAQVDTRACERAGRCPVLLLDLNFQRAEWWRRVCQGDDRASSVNAPSALFTAERVTPLLREILTEAWSIGRSMPHAASLIFCMEPRVSSAIADLSVPELDQVAMLYSQYLRPRWEESCVFWQRLLLAAIGADDEALAHAHLHCLQLVGSSLT